MKRASSAERVIADFVRRELPDRFPIVRREQPSDLKRVVDWFEAGRAERAFKEGPRATSRTLARYREEIQSGEWVHRSWVIEWRGAPVGYLDARTRGKKAELLGLYLEPSVRDRKLGRHLLRWVCAALREEGVRQVTTEVYGDNDVSLRSCRAAGLVDAPLSDRLESGRTVKRLQRSLSPLIRTRVPDAIYGRIPGINLYLHHLALAEGLSDRLMEVPGVRAVLGLGSLWRGFGDEMSDIDVAILGQQGTTQCIRTGERFVVGTSLDVFAVDIDACPPTKWDDSRRQAFGESVVLGRHPSFSPRRLKESTGLRASEQRRAAQELILALGWIGYQPESWTDRERYGYRWEVPYDVWLRRGSVASAHATADKAFDLALQMLFIANGRRVPDLKWRLFLADGLPYRPRNLADDISTAVATPRSERGLGLRAAAIRRIVSAIVRRLESRGTIRDEMYSGFLKTAADYSKT